MNVENYVDVLHNRYFYNLLCFTFFYYAPKIELIIFIKLLHKLFENPKRSKW